MITKRWRATAVLAAVALVGLTVVRPWNYLGGDKPEKAEDAHVTCGSLPTLKKQCHVITVDGRRYRYSLVRARRATLETDLVDVGGPGAAVLGAAYPRDLVTADTTHNVLLVDEPWTTRTPDAACKSVLSKWYLALRSSFNSGGSEANTAKLARTIQRRCELFSRKDRWGFSPNSYRSLLERIGKKANLKYDQFIGFSFGSVRWTYASDLFRTAKIVSPFPVRLDAEAYLSSLRAAKRYAVPVNVIGGKSERRSLAISSLDREAAMKELMYYEPGDRARLMSRSADLEYIVGKLSDAQFGRYGVNSLAPSILALWDETCPALRNWQDVPATAYRSFDGELLRVCEGYDKYPAKSSESPVKPPECLVLINGDGIVPERAAKAAVKLLGWKITAEAPGGHANSAALAECDR